MDATGLADGAGLAAPYTWKGASFPGTGGTCNDGNLTIAEGSSTIAVTYSPTGAGPHNDTILVDYNDGSVTQTASRAVTGDLVSAAVITISDAAT